MEKAGAFLGISVGSPYYSKQRISNYLSYAKKNFPAFALLIGDVIFRYTLAAFRELTIDEATARACMIGNEREAMLKSLINAETYPFEIIRWQDVERLPLYSTILMRAQESMKSSIAFKSMVRKQVFINLGNRVAVTGLSDDPNVDDNVSKLFDAYIVEEIAGLVAISESTKYNLEIYPGDDLRVLESIYQDAFPEFIQVLPSPRKRQFKKLRLT